MNMPTEIKKKPLRTILLAVALLAAVAVAGALLAHRGAREWTTGSEAALAEFRRGLEAQQKLHSDEAAEHFARAAELDPDFVAAKLFLLPVLGGAEHEDRRKELVEALGAAESDRLNRRERFLIEFHFAQREDPERALRLLDAYLEDQPNDPFALDIRCNRQWHTREFAPAERCFRRLIEIDPNWVNAQNHLGYLAMSQGEWQRAEEQFAIYRYIAPDLANPHDSLGELLLLTGRWEEAQREFEAALAVKPDFCPSWKNLVKLELLNGRFDNAARVIEGIERDGLCSQDEVRLQQCGLEVWRAFLGNQWQQAWEVFRSPLCKDSHGEAAVIAYQAALRAGLEDQAAAFAAELDAHVEKYEHDDFARAVALHLEGLRLRLGGRPEQALERYEEADSRLAYWNCEMGYLKIANQVERWHALTALGRTDDAARALDHLRTVNPDIAERWTSRPGAADAVADAAGGERSGS